MNIATLWSLGLILSAGTLSAHAQDKVLNLYNWADYFAPDTISKFTAETGIRVVYDVMDTSETLEAKMMAGHSGYDLIFPGDTVAERLMQAGSLQKLDKSKLQHLADVTPGLLRMQEQLPKAKDATVPYTWGSVGVTYNAEMVKARLGDAPVDSLDMILKPELAAKFADCGISMIDSPDEVLAVVLNYLGKDPRSGRSEDLALASKTLMAIKPYIRKFQSQPVTDIVNGDLCLSLGYSGDVTQAQIAANQAGKPSDFQFRVPREGTTVWLDTMAIPVDAKHPEYAYAFINFVMRAENMAAISNSTGYPTSSAKAEPLVNALMRDNPDIYVSDEVYARLFPGHDIPLRDMRNRNRAWSSFKAGTAAE